MSVTDRDYEQLSAYLDGELADHERTTLEGRLQSDPALQRELQSLRQTVTLIQGLPDLPAPRNFTLDADVARRPTLPFPLTLTFSALSTAAAVLLFVFGGYFLLQSNSLEQFAATAPQSQAIQAGALQDIAPTQAQEIAALPTSTATPPQTLPPPTATVLPSPIVEAVLESQMAQSTEAEGDESAAANEPADDVGLGGALPETGGEGVQAPPVEEFAVAAVTEESLDLAEASGTFDNTTSTMSGGAGMRTTAIAPAIARSLPTAAPISKASDTPAGTSFRSVAPTEPNSVAQSPADGNDAGFADRDNGQAVGRTDFEERQEAPASTQGPVAIVLLTAGALLLIVAVITTLVRRRRLHV